MHKLDDVLLHWGVKGMKWDEKKKKAEDALSGVVNKYKLSTKQAADLKARVEAKKKGLVTGVKSVTKKVSKESKSLSKKISNKIDKAITTPSEKKAMAKKKQRELEISRTRRPVGKESKITDYKKLETKAQREDRQLRELKQLNKLWEAHNAKYNTSKQKNGKEKHVQLPLEPIPKDSGSPKKKPKKSSHTTTVIGQDFDGKVGSFKVSHPFKNNEAFKKEWDNREKERAKVDKALKNGQISSKEAKSMKKIIDKKAQANLKTAEEKAKSNSGLSGKIKKLKKTLKDNLKVTSNSKTTYTTYSGGTVMESTKGSNKVTVNGKRYDRIGDRLVEERKKPTKKSMEKRRKELKNLWKNVPNASASDLVTRGNPVSKKKK